MSNFKPNYFQRRSKPQGPKANERIRALDVQVIGSDGGNLGTLPINKAIELAKDLEKLSKIRHDLRSKMNKSYMMNGKAFTQNLENTYQLMWDTYIKKTKII